MTAAAAACFDAWYLPDQPSNSRAASARHSAALLRRQGRGTAVSKHRDIAQALASAQAAMRRGDRLVVFGSFYTVAAALALLERGRDAPRAGSRQ